MMLFAVLAFTAVFALALLSIADTLAANADKVWAALSGKSLLTQPTLVTRPVTVRVVSRRVSRPVAVQPRLRAAA